MTETDVLIMGAGRIGQTPAIDLGQLGVQTVLIEKLDMHGIHLKLNAQTMEIFRRLGVSERVRCGFPRERSWTSSLSQQ